MAGKRTEIYQIKITLKGTKPPIWRRVLVPSSYTLDKFHEVILRAMGWVGYHLHHFIIFGEYYGDPSDDQWEDFGTKGEERYRLNQLVPGEGFKFEYDYDFGDYWEHIILIEKIMPPEEGMDYPVCIKGKRACPPEDVGGVWGYEDYLEALQNPEHPEHEEYVEWGGPFDPEAFDIDDVNLMLRRMS